jgi:glycine betaine/proline transport system substrate-binding protein
MKSFSGKLCALLAAWLLFAAPVQARYVSLGYVNLSFYEVTAAVVQQVLERLGYNVALQSGSHSQIYPKLGAGEMDLFVAAWLPNTHKDYWEEHQVDLVRVSKLYTDARLFWAVPDYVPASEVRTVADLSKPSVAGKMDRTIRGPGADSGLMIGSKKILEHYRLADAGYQLAPGKAADWIDGFNRNIADKQWFVMPLWRPQYLNRVAGLRVLEEPEKLFGDPDTAWLVGHKELRNKLDKYAYHVLGKIEFSLRAIEEMDYLVNVKKMSARDAARQWVGSHPNTVSYWMEPPEQ